MLERGKHFELCARDAGPQFSRLLVVPSERCYAIADFCGWVRYALMRLLPVRLLPSSIFIQGLFMDTKLLDILSCRVGKDPLKLNADKTELISKGAILAHPIRDGIPVMLESEAHFLTTHGRLYK